MKRLSVLSLFIFASILISCAPQVTVTSEVTVTLPPPTDTPIPTPTSHPQFIALQNQIDASGKRFSLLSNGTIEEMTVDGGRQTVPNLTVSPEGVMTITVDGQPVILDPAKTQFSDETGLTNDEYKQSEKGEWAANATQVTAVLIEMYSIDPETITVVDVDSVVSVTDKETAKILWQTDETGTTRYGIEFATDGIAAKSCESQPFKPSSDGLLLAEYGDAANIYITKIVRETGVMMIQGGYGSFLLIDRDNLCWGSIENGKDLVYRDSEGVAQRLRLIPMTKEEVHAFRINR